MAPGLVVTLLAGNELLQMMKARGYQLSALTTLGGAALVAASTWTPILYEAISGAYPADCPLGRLGWPWAAMGAAVVIVFLGQMVAYQQNDGLVVRIALSIFVIAYIGLMISFLFALRIYQNNETGMFALISCVAIAKSGDAGAYFSGRFLGRHKLAPRMSPGKTIEGAVGGVIASCLVSLALFYWLAPRMIGSASEFSLLGSIAFGAIVGGAGMLGDLAESVLKREFQAKDASKMLPGLGGVLDILDSLLFAAPAALACWLVGIVS